MAGEPATRVETPGAGTHTPIVVVSDEPCGRRASCCAAGSGRLAVL